MQPIQLPVYGYALVSTQPLTTTSNCSGDAKVNLTLEAKAKDLKRRIKWCVCSTSRQTVLLAIDNGDARRAKFGIVSESDRAMVPSLYLFPSPQIQGNAAAR